MFWVAAALVAAGLFVVLKNMPPRGMHGEGANHPAVGKSLAGISLAPLTGDPPPIDEASLTGKVTLINFWGTWCPPCRAEFPHVVALWEELKDEPEFQLAAVSCLPGLEKSRDDLSDTAKFLAKQGTNMPTYWDPQGRTRIALDRVVPGFGFPTTVLLDRQGTIRGVWSGYLPGMETDVEATTRAVLNEKS
jgi:thiol-disulfide isomerase/thioredoxin